LKNRNVENDTLKIIFAGTPDFAEVILEALLHSTHEIVAVLTQPDRQSGRGLKLTQSPVKQLAATYQLPIYQPSTLKNGDMLDTLQALDADVMVVAAYGLLLPSTVLSTPHLGCINVHPSLLPRWRGAAPIQRTLFAGDKESGVTIMQMEVGLDTGPILMQRTLPLSQEETAETLHDKLAKLGAQLLLETLSQLETITPVPQDTSLATYAEKISKEEALIDWHHSAQELEQMIRAFNPWPVAYTTWQEKNLRIWQAQALAQSTKETPLRTIVAAGPEGIDIATADGVLRLLKMQQPGGKVILAADFYNAHRKDLIVGKHFV
jgi:methionyl-tRNA formyltransferase